MSADSGLKCQLSICHLNTNPSNDSRFYVSETYKSDKGRPKKIENHEIRRILAAVVWRAAETSLLNEGAGDWLLFFWLYCDRRSLFWARRHWRLGFASSARSECGSEVRYSVTTSQDVCQIFNSVNAHCVFHLGTSILLRSVLSKLRDGGDSGFVSGQSTNDERSPSKLIPRTANFVAV